MKKLKIIFMLMLIASFNPVLYATSIEELDEELNSLNSNLSTLESEIENNTTELDAQKQKVSELNNQIADLDSKIGTEEVNLANLESEITSLEAENDKLAVEKDKYEKEAKESKEFTKIYLQFLQITSKGDSILNLVFNQESSADVIQSIEATKEFTEASQEVTNKLFESIIQINAKTAKIEQNLSSINMKKKEVVAKKASLETQLVSVSKSKDTAAALERDIDSKQIELLEQESNLRMQQQAAQESKAFLESAGCGPSDVYGVDCGETLPDGSISSMIRPTDSGTMTCDWMCYENHKGIDIGGYANQPIYPSAPGVVTSSMWDDAGGNMVTVVHVIDGQNFMTAYMHMNSSAVSPGDVVNAKSVLGYMGSTGLSTGVHLHFATAPGISSWDPYAGVDPRNYVNFPPYMSSYSTR